MDKVILLELQHIDFEQPTTPIFWIYFWSAHSWVGVRNMFDVNREYDSNFIVYFLFFGLWLKQLLLTIFILTIYEMTMCCVPLVVIIHHRESSVESVAPARFLKVSLSSKYWTNRLTPTTEGLKCEQSLWWCFLAHSSETTFTCVCSRVRAY